MLTSPYLICLAYASISGSWVGKTMISALIHGIIYGLVFKLFRALSLPEDFLVGAIILVSIVFFVRRRS